MKCLLDDWIAILVAVVVFLLAWIAFASVGNSQTLGELADKYGTDKGTKTGTAHDYTQVYDLFMSPMRNTAKKICEIGICGVLDNGGSLKMWRDYFPNAQICGVDILERKRFDGDRITTFVADQANREQMANVLATIGGDFDLILEDGGHTQQQQQVSFGVLFPHVRVGGYYVIEDVDIWILDNLNSPNGTLRMIEVFNQTDQVKSQYMTPAECQYCSQHIAYCNLLKINKVSITCIFKKK
jgi:hypothetical protein